jgi:hypothetical protein
MTKIPLTLASVLVLGVLAFAAAPALAAGPEKPTTIEPAASITGTSAIFEGVLNPHSKATVGGYFAYSNPEGLTCAEGPAAALEGFEGEQEVQAASVHAKVALEAKRTYKFCLVATSEGGVGATPGEEVTVTTPAIKPVVVIETAPAFPPAKEVHLEATVDPENEVSECHFQWGKASGSVTENEEECEQGNAIEGGEQGVSRTATGLTANTAYVYRVVLKNGTGEEKGTIEHFTTAIPPQTPEKVELEEAQGTVLKVKGIVNPKALGNPGSFEFLYQQSETECAAGSPIGGTSTGGEAEVVKGEATGLLPGTAYSFCLKAHNAAGEESAVSSPPVTFTTLALAPAIAGESVSAVEATAATLDAEINPGGAATTAHFEYLTQAQYEADGDTFGEHTISTPESASVGSDDSVHPATPARIAEQGQPPLAPSTTYRYRVVASNECEAGKQCVTDGVGKTFTTYPAPGSEPAQNCTNEARRVEQSSTYLPDCRAYELVTPAEKQGGEPGVHEGLGDHAAADGERMAWWAQAALPGAAVSVSNYLSTRGPDGWSSESTIPSQSVQSGLLCPELVGIDAWSSNLEKGVLADGWGQGGQTVGNETGSAEDTECGHDEPRLAAGELERFQNLFVRDNGNFARDGETDVDPYQLINVTPSAVAPPEPNGANYYPAFFLAGSADLSHVVFEEELPLTENAPGYPSEWEGHDDLYEWTASGVRLVTIMPDGTPVEGSLAGATINKTANNNRYNIADYLHAVSEDGSRVFFQAGGNLYVRENAEQPPVEECATPSKACTVQIDEDQGGTGSSGGGVFMEASGNGSKVFFTDESRLTEDSKAEAGKPDLYEYNLEAPLGKRLTDITASSTEPAGVLGVSGAGEDGSHVYFAAEGVLAGANAEGASPTPGAPNLYAYEPDPAHAGAYRTTFIATLAASDSCDWIEIECTGNTGNGLTARVSANGAFIGFTSTAQVTGYDNTDANTHNPDNEIYLYDAATETLGCASCDPSGAAPTSGAGIHPPVTPYNFSALTDAYPQRYVSDSGQVFFTSAEALLPTDTNAEPDVYEYEGGELHLISSGSSDEASYVLDASVNGGDVFFETSQQLLGAARDAAYAIYDARVEGGFPEPSASPGGGPPCESAEACKPAPGEPPIESFLASSAFSGAGNLVAPGGRGSNPPGVKPKSKPLTRAQKLAKALKVCAKDKKKSKRAKCQKQAKQKYGALKAKKATRAAGDRRTKA